MSPLSFGGATFPPNTVFETVRSERDSRILLFAAWDGVRVSTVPYLERDREKIFPAEAKLAYADQLYLPTGVAPTDRTRDLFDDLGKTISEFFDLSEDGLLLILALIFSTWHPWQGGIAPYLWVVGPFASGRSSLLRLLLRLCRHAINVADVAPSSLHKFIRHADTTLLFDEFDPRSARCRALYGLLRAGNMPDAFVARSSGLNSVFCPKIFASRQLPGDLALESRAVVVEMFRTTKKLRPLTQGALDHIEAEYQNRLLQYRFTKASRPDCANLLTTGLDDLNPRTRDLAQALLTPLSNKPDVVAKMLSIFQLHDEEIRRNQSLEPEWLVVEALFDLCHDRKGRDSICEMTIGDVAAHLNSRLKDRGENLEFSAKRVGAKLRGLRVRPIPMGNKGNGLLFTSALKEQSHKLARQFGIDRRAIAYSSSLEAGYGGAPCELCERFDVTGGLKFVAPLGPRFRAPASRRPGLLDPASADKLPLAEEPKASAEKLSQEMEGAIG